ncbi:MAG TPA: ABC transporter ATP-binding protein [Phototrophicaceae bacterium]|nr:ABC transporter ATP-binding protein [Phototrophicaceae bacterium]
MTDTARLLDVSKLTKTFRGLHALVDVDLYAAPGEILGVIGPNGAGKTTLFNCLTGSLAPTRGHIVFQGRDITGKRMPAVAKLGIARTFQNIRLFGALSVLDNVRTAQQLRTRFNPGEILLNLPSFQRKERELTDQALAHLALFGLTEYADRQASTLAYGSQRRLEIARALATSPRLLLLDEPAAGMNVSETDALHQMILEVRRRFDVTIILVEHDMRLVMNICDRITVLNYGRVLATGTPEAIRRNPDVIESYLGKTHQASAS